RLEEITGHIPFVFASMARRPALRPAVAICECVSRLQVAVRLLRPQTFRNPVVECGLHLFLRREDFPIAMRIHHEGDAHGFNCLMHPGVSEDVTFVPSMGLAAQCFGRFDEIIYPALTLSEIGAVDIINAMWNPIYDDGLGARVPKGTVN